MFGAGIMGSGIAAACVKRELPATITDAARRLWPAACRRALEEVSYNKAHARPDAQKMLEVRSADQRHDGRCRVGPPATW